MSNASLASNPPKKWRDQRITEIPIPEGTQTKIYYSGITGIQLSDLLYRNEIGLTGSTYVLPSFLQHFQEANSILQSNRNDGFFEEVKAVATESRTETAEEEGNLAVSSDTEKMTLFVAACFIAAEPRPHRIDATPDGRLALGWSSKEALAMVTVHDSGRISFSSKVISSDEDFTAKWWVVEPIPDSVLIVLHKFFRN